jgi:hypothetical protein
MFTEKELLGLLSRPFADASVRQALEKLGPIKGQKAESRVLYRFKAAGVMVTEKQARVESIALYKKGGGFAQYAGDPPFGLQFAMPRAKVQELAGDPDESGDESDVWDRGAFTLTVEYDAKGKLANVTLDAR